MNTNVDNFLLPVGRECRIPSKMEAFLVFSQNNLYGEINLGIATLRKRKEIAWILITPEKTCAKIPAFEVNQNQLGGVIKFSLLTEGSIFSRNGHNYIVVCDDCLELVIKEIDICADEATALEIAAFRGYEDAEVSLVHMFEQKAQKRFLFAAWVGYSKSKETNFLIPVFQEDMPLLESLDTENMGWEELDAGDVGGCKMKTGFVHEGKFWKVYRDKNNQLYIKEPNPFMCVAVR